MTLTVQGNSVLGFLLQDVWHNNALGGRTETIYNAIMEYEEVHIDRLINHTNLNKGIIEYAITKLYKNGLVDPLGNDYYKGLVLTEEKALEIAKKYGTLGYCEKRKERHLEERRQFVSRKLLKHKHNWMKRYGKYADKD